MNTFRPLYPQTVSNSKALNPFTIRPLYYYTITHFVEPSTLKSTEVLEPHDSLTAAKWPRGAGDDEDMLLTFEDLRPGREFRVLASSI